LERLEMAAKNTGDKVRTYKKSFRSIGFIELICPRRAISNSMT